MIVVEPVLKVSTVVVKIRRASLRQICQQEAGSPGGKRRAATSIGNDLPYPVGTAPYFILVTTITTAGCVKKISQV